MVGGQTFAQIRSERRQGLRQVRNHQRAVDSQIERIERLVFRLLDRKTVLVPEDAKKIATEIDSLYDPLTKMTNALADFMIIVSS